MFNSFNSTWKDNVEPTVGKAKRQKKTQKKKSQYTLFGEMEAGMHDCPDSKINSDVNNCPAFKKFHAATENHYDP